MTFRPALASPLLPPVPRSYFLCLFLPLVPLVLATLFLKEHLTSLTPYLIPVETRSLKVCLLHELEPLTLIIGLPTLTRPLQLNRMIEMAWCRLPLLTKVTLAA